MDGDARSQTAPVEIVRPCGQAWDHMKGMLFPIHFEKWITLGFVAFLAALGAGGGGSSFSFNFPSSGGWERQRLEVSPKELFGKAMQFFEAHMALILAIVGAGLVLCTAVYAALSYLGSRGVFMYLDCIAERKAAVVEPWRRSRERAWSYFLWKVLIDAIALSLMLLIGAGAVAATWHDIRSFTIGVPTVLIWVLCGMLLLPVLLAFGLARWCLSALVAPIMYLRGVSGRQGWRELGRLARGDFGVFVLFWLMNLLLGLLVGVSTVVATFCTCCLCCIGAWPILRETLLQPLLLWVRAYPFYFLAQFGEAYRLPTIAAAAAAVPAAEPGPVAAMKVATCPRCGQPHQIPGGLPGTYACVRCGGHFDVT